MKFSSLHADKYTHHVAYVFYTPQAVTFSVVFNKYFHVKLSDNNVNPELGIIPDTCMDTWAARVKPTLEERVRGAPLVFNDLNLLLASLHTQTSKLLK